MSLLHLISYPVRIFCLQLYPGCGCLLRGNVGLVSVVGLVEAEDDGILGLHLVVDVVMPGPVSLVIAPHHGDELLALRGWPTGA